MFSLPLTAKGVELVGGADFELLAAAAYLVGHVDEWRQALQRAHGAHIAAVDLWRAAGAVLVAFKRCAGTGTAS
jgi:hypothetical protein